ncbi:hypothetical protein PG5_39050 [Pseudomonas sp. G5(2012)]|nr:hypothetical protein PG5_39050 [Pseudomonas sp. G5(2012)]
MKGTTDHAGCGLRSGGCFLTSLNNANETFVGASLLAKAAAHPTMMRLT